MTLPATNVDYTLQTRAAQERVERLESELEKIDSKRSLCREAWRDYGAGLLAQRAVMKSKPEFGAWIRQNGFDQGRMKSQTTRTAAMWLAEVWANQKSDFWLEFRSHHPLALREECRAAGHAWAYGKRQPRKTPVPREQKPKGYVTRLSEAGLLTPAIGSKERKRLLAELLSLAKLGSYPRVITPELDAQLDAAIAMMRAKHHKAPTREELHAVEQRKLDAALAKAKAELDAQYKQRYVELQSSFSRQVDEQVATRLSTEAKARIDSARQKMQAAEGLERVWRSRAEACKAGVLKFMENRRTLAQCLHPDKAPEDRRPQFARAMEVVNCVTGLFEEIGYGKW